jgi:hypothetical protein
MRLQALRYYQKYVILKDSLFNIANQKKFLSIEFENKITSAKIELEKRETNAEHQLQKQKLSATLL